MGIRVHGFWVSVLHVRVSLLVHGYMGFWLTCSSLLFPGNIGLWHTIRLFIGFWVSVLHFTVSLHLHGHMSLIAFTWVNGLLAFLFFTSLSWLYGFIYIMGYYSSLHKVLGFCFSLYVSLYLHGYMSLVAFLRVQGF